MMADNSSKNRCVTSDKISNWTVNQIKKRFPVVVWFPKYKWAEDLYPDLLAGVTLMFLYVPQGLAFSVLANVDLMFGLYTSCFSAFLYTLLGTATFSSFGPVAVGSMLTGEAVGRVVTVDYTTSEIAVVITFLIGIWYLIGFILRLGVISVVFRKPFVTGFITACALQILVKTLKMVFGMKTPNSSGRFAFFYNCYAVVDNFHLVNYPTIIISSVILVVLILNTTVFRHILAKYTKFVLPMEAIVMTIVTVVSYFFSFECMGVPVVGEVPTGLPTPKFPEMSLIYEVWDLSLVIAVINYSTTVSMTLLFNKGMNRDQELLAMSAVNLICCNFQCLTIGNSMMRTVIAMNLGVRTLLATSISSLLLVFVILFGGPVFQPLPTCVLGCIIIVSAGQLLLQRIQDVKSVWKSSWENGFIWAVSLSAGLVIDLQIGMIAGALLTFRQIMSEMVHRETIDEEKEKHEVVNLDNGEPLEEPPETDKLLNKDNINNVKIV